MNCLQLLTWGEGGVENGQKHAYVICGRPLIKKWQCIFAGRICRPGTDIAESFHLSKNKFNHDRVYFFSVTKENVGEMSLNF